MMEGNVKIYAHAMNLWDKFTAPILQTMVAKADAVLIQSPGGQKVLMSQAIALHAAVLRAIIPMRYTAITDMTVMDVGWVIIVQNEMAIALQCVLPFVTITSEN